MVICKVGQDIKLEHERRLKLVTNDLISWMYKQEVMMKGYLEEEDFPDWLNERQRRTLRSRVRLFYALLENL